MIITITIDTGKETAEIRSRRIAETQNGRTTRTRTVPDKKKAAAKRAARGNVKI